MQSGSSGDVVGKFEALDFYDGVGWVAKGWAVDNAERSGPAKLVIVSDRGEKIAVAADQHREDLAAAGIGDGHCAFEVMLPSAMLDGEARMLSLHHQRTGLAVDGSPKLFNPQRVRGRLGGCIRLAVEGWAVDDVAPETPVVLRLEIDGRFVQLMTADQFREDLAAKLGGKGNNAFRAAMPSEVFDGQTHRIAVHAVNGGGELQGSPTSVRFAPETIPSLAHHLVTKRDETAEALERHERDAARAPYNELADRELYGEWLAHHEANWPEADTSTRFRVLVSQDIALDRLRRWLGAQAVQRHAIEALPNAAPTVGEWREVLAAAPDSWTLIAAAKSIPHPRAFAVLAEAIEADQHDIVYCDDDILVPGAGRERPRFKPDWDPDRFLEDDYVGLALCAHPEALLMGLDAYAGERIEPEALLSAALLTASPHRIGHVPRVLFHRLQQGGVTPAQQRSRWLSPLVNPAGIDLQPTEHGTLRAGRRVPDTAPSVTLIIPTRDRIDLLRPCIESIEANTDYEPYEILIVDNASTCHEALAYLRELEESGRARVLRDNRPFNFAALNNAAVRCCETELVALVNNDIEATSRAWLREMVSHAIRPEVGAVGARLLYPDGLIQHGGVIVGLHGVADNSQKAYKHDDTGYHNTAVVTQNVSAVTAACLVCRRETYLAVGGLDDVTFPIAFNDVDFCLKLRQQHMRVIWTPHAVLRHHESVSRGPPTAPANEARERAEASKLRTRWGTDVFADPFYSPNLGRLDYAYLTFRWPDEEKAKFAEDVQKRRVSIGSGGRPGSEQVG